jgi:opacity protein-like surface antigen
MTKLLLPLLVFFTATYSFAEHYLKISQGIQSPQTNGALYKNLETNTSLKDGNISTIEAGFTTGFEGFSFGFEYANSKTDASSLEIADADEAIFYSNFLEATINVGETYVKEEYDINMFSLKLNYDWFLNDYFNVTLSGGLGLMSIDQKLSYTNSGSSNNYSSDDLVITYQFGVSLDYYLFDSTSLSLGARYIGAEDANFEYDGVTLNNGDASSVVYEVSIKHIF